mgnify:CR=1 FL=1
MSKLKEVESYLETLGYSQEEIKGIETNRVSLASAIMLYAHQGQKRINGEPYYYHPQRVYFSLRDFIGADDEGKNINEEWLDRYVFPLKGTQEVALLHDVVEDKDFTMSDIESIYNELEFGEYFRKYIKDSLEIITHKKDASYENYIEEVLLDKRASIVKFLDLHDNLNFLSLNEFGILEFERCEKYLKYVKQINDKHHFIENGRCYRELFKNKTNI